MYRRQLSPLFFLVLLLAIAQIVLSCGGGNNNNCGTSLPNGGFVAGACQTPIPPIGRHLVSIDICPGSPPGPTPSPSGSPSPTPTLTPCPAATATTAVVGGTAQFHAVGTFQKNSTISFSDITNAAGTGWFSNNANVFYNGNGNFSAVDEGCSCIVVSSGGITSGPMGVAIAQPPNPPPLCSPCPTSAPTPSAAPKATAPLPGGDEAQSAAAMAVVQWEYEARAPIAGQIIPGLIGDLFFISANGLLHRLDSHGHEIFGRAAGGKSPVVSGQGIIYAEGPAGGLMALDPDGSLRWQAAIGSGAGPLAIGPDGTVYAAADGDLVAISANARVKWRVGLAGLRQVVVTPDGGIAAVNDGGLTMFSADGAVQWTFAPPQGLSGNVAAVNDTVYAVSLDGVLHALASSNGAEVWHSALNGTPAGIAAGPAEMLYAAADKVYAYLSDGRLVWTSASVAPRSVAPAVGPDSALYVAVDGGHLASIGADGGLQWVGGNFGEISSMVLSSVKSLYVVSTRGDIYAIEVSQNR